MTTWWSERAARERLMVAGGGLLVLVLLGWALLWHPLAQSRADLGRRVSQQEQLLHWMRNASEDVRRVRARTVAGAGARGEQSLLALVDESLRAHGLGPAVRRVEPDGSDAVRLWLDAAPFDDLMRWLVTLDRGHGTAVGEFSAQATDRRGLVNASLTLRR